MGWFLDESRLTQHAAGEILKPCTVGGSSRLGRWVGGSKGYAIQLSLAKQAAQQGHKGGADEGDTAAGHELFDPQIGGSYSSMAGGGVSETI